MVMLTYGCVYIDFCFNKIWLWCFPFLLLSILSKHQGIVCTFHTTFPFIKLISLDHAVTSVVSLLYYYLMSFLSEPLSPLWSQQQFSSSLPAVAVVTLPLQAVAWVLGAGVLAVAWVLVARVFAVVLLLLFKPAVEVWYAGWQVDHKPAVLTSSCTSRGGLYKVYTWWKTISCEWFNSASFFLLFCPMKVRLTI